MKKLIFTCFVALSACIALHAQPGTIDTIAEKMLLLQRSNGGWSKTFMDKAVNYKQPFGKKERQTARKERGNDDTTIDNRATTREITYLLEAYGNTHNIRYKEAAIRGVDYLLAAQYDNGGWPQYYPDNRIYRSQVTYNDDAMINVLKVLDGISRSLGDYAILTDARGSAAEKAVQNGVQCILATQVVLHGKKTIWAAQYDKDTLVPATARTYELPSLASSESANILLFLMARENPTEDEKAAIRNGVEWFANHVIEGYTMKIVAAPNEPTKKDRILVKAPDKHVWARFYDLDEQKPLFAGRDGQPHRRLDEVENERRVGYSWYGEWGDKVIRQYAKWQQKH
ncbi:pectate lyase [Parapedobacter soli]|uniref:pectate lyase n=1 Tax=Parapedobacter soli TaxID=416955 RepID=UPI0021C9F0FB|nr:pectate lyase [Parapedobacter soli]